MYDWDEWYEDYEDYESDGYTDEEVYEDFYYSNKDADDPDDWDDLPYREQERWRERYHEWRRWH